MEDLMAHPTAKPVAVVKDAIMDVSARGDIVWDTFLGGGATLMAAEARGRVPRGVELDPLDVDVVLRRWRSATGISLAVNTTVPVRLSWRRTASRIRRHERT